MNRNYVLTIGGSDPSCGAGIQGDVRTILSLGYSPLSAVTALTCQDEERVTLVQGVETDFLKSQLDSLALIYHIGAIKIGMLFNEQITKTVAAFITSLKSYVPVVLDPVFNSSNGTSLLTDKGVSSLIEDLLPLVTIVTPNTLEAARISHISINTEEDMVKSAEIIASLGARSVLVKGGHLDNALYSQDLLLESGEANWFSERRTVGKPLHGTGCALSSAIACELSMGFSLNEGVKRAKRYVTRAIESAYSQNFKSVDHFWMTRRHFESSPTLVEPQL